MQRPPRCPLGDEVLDDALRCGEDTKVATSLWGYVLTAALVGPGVWFGTRTFRRENS